MSHMGFLISSWLQCVWRFIKGKAKAWEDQALAFRIKMMKILFSACRIRVASHNVMWAAA